MKSAAACHVLNLIQMCPRPDLLIAETLVSSCWCASLSSVADDWKRLFKFKKLLFLPVSLDYWSNWKWFSSGRWNRSHVNKPPSERLDPPTHPSKWHELKRSVCGMFTLWGPARVNFYSPFQGGLRKSGIACSFIVAWAWYAHRPIAVKLLNRELVNKKSIR